MKLKHLLALTMTLVTGVALLASFAILYVILRAERIESLDRTILSRARPAAEMDPKHITLLSPRWVVLYDLDRNIAATTSSFAPRPPEYSTLGVREPIPEEGSFTVDLEAGGVPLRGVVVPAIAGGRLLYAIPRTGLEQDLASLARLFGLVIVGVLAFTALISLWLGGRLSRDVNAIARVARAVESGDLSARLAAPARGSVEMHEVFADLNRMIAELEQLVTAQRTFISHAAHELRSPLTTLQVELELALRRPRSAEEYEVVLHRALADARHLVALAEDLLLLARLQRRGPSDASASVGEVIDHAMRMVRKVVEPPPVEVLVDADHARGHKVRGEARDLARALRNLVDNAVDHSPPGSVVRVQASVEGASILLAVEDEGEGVAPADVPHLFSPFYRGARDQGGARPGAGLGLAIAREIARLSGGDVNLDTERRRGARFVLEVPRVPGTPGSAA